MYEEFFSDKSRITIVEIVGIVSFAILLILTGNAGISLYGCLFFLLIYLSIEILVGKFKERKCRKK